MHLKIYQNRLSNLWAENRLLKFVVVVLAGGCIACICLSLRAMDKQRVVILPPVVDRRVVISGNEVNEDYVKLFARYTTSLFLNYSPATFSIQAEDLLKLASPEAFPTLRKSLMQIKDTVERLHVSSVFYPHEITVDAEQRKITVKGMMRRYAQRSMVDEGIGVYLIRYKIIDGRFFVDGIKDISSR